ncbi:LssY C-terminal domain-containing protein [Rubripirellula amarantea]|nr:LssY C-terminal domain-containing protein [Rubripirellula amarantea]
MRHSIQRYARLDRGTDRELNSTAAHSGCTRDVVDAQPTYQTIDIETQTTVDFLGIAIMAFDVDTGKNDRGIRLATAAKLKLVVGLLVSWLLAAYIVAPYTWSKYAKRHPSFDDNPRVTQTGDHHPGDPLNVALIGTEVQIQTIMHAAEWFPAATLGLKSDLKIAADSILSRPDKDAPVSSLYLFGRREDLAFEQAVGDNPRHRHHIRLWKTDELSGGRRKWIGSAVYDRRVGLSHTTGEITHVTAADVDAERDYLFECLRKTGQLQDEYAIAGFHTHLEGRNGGGDRWQTDGSLYVGIIASNSGELAPNPVRPELTSANQEKMSGAQGRSPIK